MRVARSVKLLAAHRRREAVLSETTKEKTKVRVRLFVPVFKRPAVMNQMCPVLHRDYNSSGTSVVDSLLE